MRDLLLAGVREGIPDVNVNGPADKTRKLPGNLSLSFRNVDGSALIVSLGDLAASALVGVADEARVGDHLGGFDRGHGLTPGGLDPHVQEGSGFSHVPGP